METFDLNKAKGRKVIEVVVADKTFRISRVVTGVRQLYADYMVKAKEMLEKADSLVQAEDENVFDYQDRVNRISAEVEEFATGKQELCFQMIDLILSKNGYELNRSWWIEETDEIDQQQFLDICLTKDAPSQKKKMTGRDSTTKN